MKKRINCILDTLKRAFSPFISIQSLKRKCGKNIDSLLKKLEKEGKVVSKGKKYSIPERAGYIKGIFDGKREGYGFLMPAGDMKDLFISPNDTYTALNTDLILAKKTRKSRGRWKARVVQIIERGREYFVGKIISVDDKLVFQPNDKDIPYYFELENANRVKEGDWVIAKFLKWTTPTLSPLVKFSKKIHKDNLYDIIVKQEYKLRHTFPKPVIKEVKKVSPGDSKEREDFTNLTTFTIDPVDAKDLDDAISIRKDHKNYHLWVHISDVSGMVKRDSAIDKEAKSRGCTTYLPNDTYFMLPPVITKKLSLQRGKVCSAITVYISFDRDGKPREKKFYKSLVKSDKKFSYQEAQNILEGKAPSKFKGDLKIASELARILSLKRNQEGYLDFHREEVKVELEDSHPAGVSPKRELWTNQIIEQFMIAANEAVAETSKANKTPNIYRIHEEPDRMELERFKDLVESLGFSLESIKREELSNFLSEIKGSTYERILNYELLRCMKKARYIAHPEPHYGLASNLYTHFTSPVRRYPDLIVQRILFGEKYSEEELEGIADHSTKQEWSSDEAEREVTNFYILKYLEENKWEKYRGMVVDIASDGIWVELNEYLVRGFIPIKLLPPDEYKIKNHALSGKRHNFQIGDFLFSRIYTVFPETGELTLEYSGKIKRV
ncbi:MAG: VacB/RNase II family 3'-5' exoribonuclease [candidate division WOR-3 bacterium]|nr:VacB/RNase II family 3'-5' exoribonuclease [candidate division WOR-3 bacterium]